MREPNLEKLNALVGKLVGDLGISLAAQGACSAIAWGNGDGGWCCGHSVRACQEDRSA